MSTKKHTEEAFERAIVASLVSDGGLTEGDPSTYDIDKALFVPDVLAYLWATQRDKLEKLRLKVPGDIDTKLIDWLCKSLQQRGALAVLREGFKFYGKTLRVVQFKPAFAANPATVADYATNRVTVTRQVHFDPRKPLQSIDLVLAINGIPVVTSELKNPMTGQGLGHAERQYKYDRDPSAPLFRFKERALVHFAVAPDAVSMTTRLAKDGTFFLPFNKGKGTGAGNPPAPDNKHRTHYLWEQVWQRDSLLELVERFIHLQVEERVDPNTGKKTTSETMSFPRYHQLRVVRRLIAASAANGPGKNYLVQHSAGSGKSNSIAWLAHHLHSLHNSADNKVFDAVVVLTDRRVLDKQLQNTIGQFEHVTGVVQCIDKNSQQLADALGSGASIIISTIHKFGFIADKIAALPDRNYAIIVDEAHSSQSGEMADAVKDMLSGSDLEAQLKDEIDEENDPTPADQLALRAALLRGPRPNISYYAFTATPKFKTLKLFGHDDTEGKPMPFDLYSMRQAIEEEFILDVLKGYQTWKAYYQLVKKIDEDPELPKRKASTALARFVSLHPHNIAQKTEIIIDHFRRHVVPELGGKAKAMVVTSSRLHATRYKRAFDAHLKDKRYTDVTCLVAFSGEVSDPDLPEKVTEGSMNPPQLGDLAAAFDTDAFNVLIVANKYQTGFDQPKLVAMYVDKKLAGVQAVQTLSRLNRRHNDKRRTFVLDFVNTPEDILSSFQPFYEATTIDEDVDPQRLYELQTKLDQSGVYLPSEVNLFAKVFFDPRFDVKKSHAEMTASLTPAKERYAALEEEAQADWKKTAVAYVNLYSFLGQVGDFTDGDLEKLYVFLRKLLPVLRDAGADPTRVNLDGDVALETYRLEKLTEGDIQLQQGGDASVSGPTATGTGAAEEVSGPLSELLAAFNERNAMLGDTSPPMTPADGKVLEAVCTDMANSDRVEAAAKANDETNFGLAIKDITVDVLVQRMERNEEIAERVLGDDVLLTAFATYLRKSLYEPLRAR